METATTGLTETEFDERYSELFTRLTRLARALGMAYESEDVAQEVLVTGRRQLHALRDGERLEPWLRRMLVRSASHYRSRQPIQLLDHTVAYVPEDTSGMVDLGVAIAGLPNRERIAISLVYGLGYSQEEAAQAMDITRGGVAALLFKARKRLARSVQAP